MAGPRMTLYVHLVLRAFLAAPGREMYGLEIMRAAGLPSGTVYPILARLESAGWLSGRAEDINPRAEGRPPRRYYRLTAAGTAAARQAAERSAVQFAALGITAARQDPGTAVPVPAAAPPVPRPRDRAQPQPRRSGHSPSCKCLTCKPPKEKR